MSLPTIWPHKVKSGNTTIPIYRSATKKGYVEFKCVWYDANRKRRFKTFAEFEAARKHAQTVNASIGSGEINALTLTNDDRLVYLRAKETVRELAIPLDTAVNDYAQARKELKGVALLDAVRFYVQKHPRSFTVKTVGATVAEMIAAKESDKLSPEYIRDLKMRLGHFADCFHVNVTDLSAEQINQFLREELAEVSGRTRNNYRAAIGTLLSFARAQGYIAKDHIEFEQLARAKEDGFVIDIYTPDQIAKLLDAARLNPNDLEPGYNRRYAARDELVAVLCLGAFAGLRTKEILRQRWSDINLESGMLRVTGVKRNAARRNTAQRRLVPISSNLRQWLALCRRDDGVCCEYPRPWEALERVAQRAGVELKHNALRHSFISYRVAETQNVPQVALEAGNSVAMIHRHYRELVTQKDGTAWFNIVPEQPANVIPVQTAA